MRVALYLRVSTDKQETENQAAQLREFAAKQDWEIVSEYADYESGSKADRAGFRQMFADAADHKFDLLLFWALDRLSREGVLETLQYLNKLTNCGVGFRSYTEQFFDSCGIFKDAIIAIMATLAKQERVKRAERTKAGLARVKASGKAIGRPRLAVDDSGRARREKGFRPAAAQLQASARRAHSLRTNGLSGRAIARQMGISEATVRRLLRQNRLSG